MAQKLTATGKRDKAARDSANNKTPARRAKKAHAQRVARANPSAAKGKDKDQRFKTVKANRGNDGEGTKKESGNNYKT
jgi:hypothetical protein